MTKELKDQWIAALRGLGPHKYKQGHGGFFMKITNTYCCLGVLCDILPIRDPPDSWVGFQGWSTRPDWVCGGDTGVLYSGNEYHGKLPKLLMNDIGFPETQQSILVEMNDRLAKSFEEIADYIQGEF